MKPCTSCPWLPNAAQRDKDLIARLFGDGLPPPGAAHCHTDGGATLCRGVELRRRPAVARPSSTVPASPAPPRPRQ